MTSPILIVDGMNLFVRNYAANPAMSTNGDYIGGVLGFTGMLASIVRQLNPRKVVVIWEAGGAPRKRALYPEYKQGRKPVKTNRYYDGDDNSIDDSEENKIWQVRQVTRILNNLPISQVYVPDCEADDVIGYLCRYRYVDEEKIILSSDKDFYQLVDDKTRIYTPTKKAFVKTEDVLKEFNIAPHNFCVAKAFCGDASDNINGVERVGFKTLAKKFPVLASDTKINIEDIITEAEERSQVKKPLKMYTRIVSSADIVRRNWKLMYLDLAMLDASQIKRINETLDTFTPTYNKLKVHEERQTLGLIQLDVERVCNSVAYLVYQQ